jgi:hypothetical protein
MCAWENQQTGDAGQALVTSALTRAKFLVGSLTPDPGEDLWVEVDGRKNIAEGAFPLRALLQVKATAEAIGECLLDLDVDDLRRWAAQPLPVFVVGVSTFNEAYFVKSIDDIISEDLQGKNVFELRTKTARVRINPTNDVASTIQRTIEIHYQSLKLTLAGVSEDDRKAHYFEVLSHRDPEPIGLVPTVGWFILWKSPARPQHFAAMISELIRLCDQEDGDHQPRPAAFHFHIYRSIEDRHHNLAVARVDVVNPRHPKRAQISQTLGIEGEYRVRHDGDLKPTRDFFRSKTVSAVEFRTYARTLGPMLDALSDKILARRVQQLIWNDALNGEFAVVDQLWNNGPFAPSECGPLDAALSGYYNCLLAHRHIEVYRSGALAAATVSRLLRSEEEKLGYFRGTWRVLLDIGR